MLERRRKLAVEWRMAKIVPRHSTQTPQPTVTQICICDYVGGLHEQAKFHLNRIKDEVQGNSFSLSFP